MLSEGSCSDCKIEFIHRNWSKLLLKWINRCINKGDQNARVRRLGTKCMSDIMTKYKKDVCDDDTEIAMLCSDDMEPFIKYKYPILRLRYLTEETDLPKKLYIMTSILLYHCCVNSHSGVVHQDIFKNLKKHEQELVLKFCERLKEMETTINNIEVAIQEAFEAVFKTDDVPSEEPLFSLDVRKSSDTAAQMSSTSTVKSSVTSLPSDPVMIKENIEPSPKSGPSKFTSSITVLPSVVTDTSIYSDDELGESDDDGGNRSVAEKDVYVDSDEIKFYTQDKSKKKYKRDKDDYVDSDEINFYTQDKSKKEPKRDKDDYVDSDEINFYIQDKSKKVSMRDKDDYVDSDEINFYTQDNIKKESKIDKDDYVDSDEISFYTQYKSKKISKRDKDDYVDSDEISFYTQDKSKKESKRDKDDYETEESEMNVERVQKAYERLRRNKELDVLKQTSFKEKDDNMTQFRKKKSIKTKTMSAMALTTANNFQTAPSSNSKNPHYIPDCANCNDAGPCSGDPGRTLSCSGGGVDKPARAEALKLAISLRFNRKITALLVAIVLCIVLTAVLSGIALMFFKVEKKLMKVKRVQRLAAEWPNKRNIWRCVNYLCNKIYQMQSIDDELYDSHSYCTLVCSGPQIWPQPIGHKTFSKKIITLATNKLEYKLKTVPSDKVHRHLSEAFKLFIGNLAKLEKSGRKFKTDDLNTKQMNIQIDVESDPDPRLRLNTEESYQLKIETRKNQVIIKIASSSFCGVRHGLETLTQMILLDKTNGHLITVANADIKDAPSFKYRGLMIDTGRNYIPVHNIMRTVDAMATVKLNTLHWRISDVASFPLFLPKVPQLFEYGAYDRSMVYTKDDVRTVVKRAAVRGIRVLMEIAVPGPVGRPWSWSPGASCPSRYNNTCDNILCLKLDTTDSVLNVLQILYEEVLDMTGVDDIFHLSNGLFSLTNCYNLLNDRDGFLDKALERLKLANKGFLPKLPVIWYTSHLSNDFEAKTWERFGVQLNEWKPNPEENFLSKFKVIHSSKWELSCEMTKQRCRKYRNWQEMYSWKSWRNVQAFTVEGGEAVLWTDLVDSGSLDYHLWPRTAAVAERLWSDIVANSSADGAVYVRLNNHRMRMMRDGVKVQPIWPAWCTYNPGQCLKKVQ